MTTTLPDNAVTVQDPSQQQDWEAKQPLAVPAADEGLGLCPHCWPPFCMALLQCHARASAAMAEYSSDSGWGIFRYKEWKRKVKLPDLSLRPGGAAPGQEGGLPAAGVGWAAHADSCCRGSLSVPLYVRSSNSPFFYYSGIRPKLY